MARAHDADDISAKRRLDKVSAQDGRQIRIELTITDANGRTASDSHTPVPYFEN